MTHSSEFQRLLAALEREWQRKAAYKRQQNRLQVFGTVAIQKVDSQYMVNVIEFDESMIDIDEVLLNETSHHPTAEAALQHIATSAGVTWSELKHSKGKKLIGHPWPARPYDSPEWNWA